MATTREEMIQEIKQYKNQLQNLMMEFSRLVRFDLSKTMNDKQKVNEFRNKIVDVESKISILRQRLFLSFSA
jgi:uncharacterized protein YlzI (FlbEa/FlbD family)